MSGWKELSVFRGVIDSWDVIRQKWLHLSVPLAFDMLFMIAFGGVLTFFQLRISAKLMEIQQYLSGGPNLSGQLLGQSSIAAILEQQQSFRILTDEIIKQTVLFFIAAYFVYVIFQSVSWYWSHRMTGEKLSFWKYVGTFAYVNLFWLVLTGLLVYFGVRITLFNKLSFYPIIEDSTGIALVVGTMIVTGFFMLISYGLIGRSDWKEILLKTFRIGIKKIHIFLGVDLVFVLSVVLVSYVLKWAFSVDFRFMMVLGILLFIPLLSWLRILQIVVVKEIEKR